MWGNKCTQNFGLEKSHLEDGEETLRYIIGKIIAMVGGA
jgi:hypothetical protein